MNMEASTSQNGGSNAKEQNRLDFSKGEETVKNEYIDGTPFTLKYIKDKGYSLGVGDQGVTGFHEDEKIVLESIGYRRDEKSGELLNMGRFPWSIIMGVIAVVVDTHSKIKGGILNGN